MQFLTSLFGGSGNMWLTALFALGVVIVLIFIVMWLLRLLAGGNGANGRGRRDRRLAVVDSLALDQKRQLLIVRRDDVEHLILTGGPADVVVETGIPVVEPARAVPQRRPPFGKPAEPQAPIPAPAATAAAAPAPAQTAPAVAPTPEPPSSNVSPLERMRTATGNRRNGKLRHPGLKDDPARPQEEAETGAPTTRDSAKESGDDNGGNRSDDEAQAKAEGRAGDGG